MSVILHAIVVIMFHYSVSRGSTVLFSQSAGSATRSGLTVMAVCFLAIVFGGCGLGYALAGLFISELGHGVVTGRPAAPRPGCRPGLARLRPSSRPGTDDPLSAPHAAGPPDPEFHAVRGANAAVLLRLA